MIEPTDGKFKCAASLILAIVTDAPVMLIQNEITTAAVWLLPLLSLSFNLVQNVDSFPIASLTPPSCISRSASEPISHAGIARFHCRSVMWSYDSVHDSSIDINLEHKYTSDCIQQSSSERRSFLEKSALAFAGFASSATTFSPFNGAYAAEEDALPPQTLPATATISEESNNLLTAGNFDCLLDLPPITSGCGKRIHHYL